MLVKKICETLYTYTLKYTKNLFPTKRMTLGTLITPLQSVNIHTEFNRIFFCMLRILACIFVTFPYKIKRGYLKAKYSLSILVSPLMLTNTQTPCPAFSPIFLTADHKIFQNNLFLPIFLMRLKHKHPSMSWRLFQISVSLSSALIEGNMWELPLHIIGGSSFNKTPL